MKLGRHQDHRWNTSDVRQLTPYRVNWSPAFRLAASWNATLSLRPTNERTALLPHRQSSAYQEQRTRLVLCTSSCRNLLGRSPQPNVDMFIEVHTSPSFSSLPVHEFFFAIAPTQRQLFLINQPQPAVTNWLGGKKPRLRASSGHWNRLASYWQDTRGFFKAIVAAIKRTTSYFGISIV